MELPNSKLIFVTGASRSGTTMLCRIFGQHSDVCSLNELHVFGDLIKADRITELVDADQQAALAKKIVQRQRFGIFHSDKPLVQDSVLDRVLEQLDAERRSAADVFRLCVDSFASEVGKVIACEQTPRNIFYAEKLMVAYPNAHIVHIVRDPRSVLASQKGKWRRKFLGGDQIPWIDVVRMWCNYHPITLSKLWIKANQKASVLSANSRFHLIKFEALLDSPAETLSSLCDGIGIAYQAEMLNIRHIGSSHQTNNNAAKGISKATTDSWKENLSPAEISVSQRLCASMMRHYGYTNLTANRPSIFDHVLLALRFPVHLIGVVLFNTQRAKIQITSMLNKVR